MARSYAKTYGMNVTLSNCSNNYGPWQHDEKLIPTIIRRCLAHTLVPLYGNGLNVRDWLWVNDHCRALDLIFIKRHRVLVTTWEGIVSEVISILLKESADCSMRCCLGAVINTESSSPLLTIGQDMISDMPSMRKTGTRSRVGANNAVPCRTEADCGVVSRTVQGGRGNLIEVCRDLRMRDLTAVKLKIQHNSTSEVRQPVKPHFSLLEFGDE